MNNNVPRNLLDDLNYKGITVDFPQLVEQTSIICRRVGINVNGKLCPISSIMMLLHRVDFKSQLQTFISNLPIPTYFTKLWSTGLDDFLNQQTDIGEWMEELFCRDRINIKQNGITRFICRFPCCGGNTVNYWPGMLLNASCPRFEKSKKSSKIADFRKTVG